MKFPWMKSEEDFLVEEILDKKFGLRFSRGRRISKISGNYTLCKLTKKGITTEEALRRVSEIIGVEEKNIGYAGLKDKFAVAVQYVTIKDRGVEKYRSREISLEPLAKINRPITVGDLAGNRFSIKLPKISNKKKSATVPNLFGPQRFGKRPYNHLIGLKILCNDFSGALEMINVQSHQNHESLRDLSKKKLKFYIHAYQSHVFNTCLNPKNPYFGYVPLPGYNSRLSGIFGSKVKSHLASDGITTKSFKIDNLRLRVDGSRRKAFIRVDLEYEKDRVFFVLPKGSYASIVIQDIT